MREAPSIRARDNDVFVSALEYRRGRKGADDWYVTWTTRSRPWEVSVMRLPGGKDAGSAWHHGRSVDYAIDWAIDWLDDRRAEHERPRGSSRVALPAAGWTVKLPR
ncbi:MAG: hypothetical protein AAF933_10780 [Pseudomonadota bacterium]